MELEYENILHLNKCIIFMTDGLKKSINEIDSI